MRTSSLHTYGGRQHGASRVDGVAALQEDLGARRGTKRLAGDRHPLLPVQWRLVSALCGHREGEQADQWNGQQTHAHYWIREGNGSSNRF
jgi:hypothetical protein